MCDDALRLLKRELQSTPEIAAAIAVITLQLQFLLSSDKKKNEHAFTLLLSELDTIAANVALTYRRSPIPCPGCGDSVHDRFPCPFLFDGAEPNF